VVAVELLAGPYVHHLPGGGERVLAASDPNFVALATLPAWVPAAFVAAEDARFFAHHGFDGEQLRRSFTIDIAAGKIERGGSTISQQLVKNLYLGPERTLARKLLEAVLTWRLEQAVAKARILEAYLNVIELGAGVYGIGPGARRWFGKPAARMTPAEAAFLAAVTAAPSTNEARFAATGRLDPDTLRRAQIILAAMRRASAVHTSDYGQAVRELAALRPASI
jgi:membrane peptidoglycan carboxypeptidase